MIAQFHAQVTKQGEIRWHHERGLRNFLAANPERHFRVAFHEPKRPRTLPQNNWYHDQIVEAIMESVGEYGVEGHERVHEALKAKYLGFANIEVLGQTIQRPRSTRDLSTKEFAAFCEAIRADAAAGEFGHPIIIEDPE